MYFCPDKRKGIDCRDASINSLLCIDADYSVINFGGIAAVKALLTNRFHLITAINRLVLLIEVWLL